MTDETAARTQGRPDLGRGRQVGRTRPSSRLDEFELSAEDEALLDTHDHLLGDEAKHRPAPGGRRRRPPQRRQVQPRQPNPPPSRGRRRGRARRHPRPGVLRGGRWPPVHHRGHGRLGVPRDGIHLRVAEQAEIAIELADVVMFVVDATVGATDDDEAVVRLLRKPGKPVVLIANKVDDERGEADAAALWNLGLGEPWPVSALHGRGSGDALDAVLEVLPEVSATVPTPRAGRAVSP